ncbi:MAG: hypothetical protein ACRET4_12660 [Steroidobacteraceae bacterium]
MMPRILKGVALGLTAAVLGIAAHAQGAPPPGVSTGQPTEGSGFNGALTHTDLQKLGDYIDRAHMLTGGDPVKVKAAAHEATAKLAGELSLSCDVTDAEQVGRGKVKVDGKTVDVNAYEVACGNGTGYFIVSQGSEMPAAMSCFAADAAHAADVAAGAKSDMYCQLPGNRDVKAMAASLMQSAGTNCAVRDLRWFGQSSQTRTEYQEVVCGDGKGFLLRTALAGTSTPTQVMSCTDAAKQGLKCKLTDGGPVSTPVTMDLFKESLVQHGVKCTATQSRLMGQENVRKRYAVEFACPEMPNGLVALIPLAGNSNPFETIDCAQAVERHLLCQFTSN